MQCTAWASGRQAWNEERLKFLFFHPTMDRESAVPASPRERVALAPFPAPARWCRHAIEYGAISPAPKLPKKLNSSCKISPGGRSTARLSSSAKKRLEQRDHGRAPWPASPPDR